MFYPFSSLDRMSSRCSGVLMHVTSLPGPFGIGDLGPSAYGFVDFLQSASQMLWQVLPLVPAGVGFSPYSSPSTFAFNPLLISPDKLHDVGLLTVEELDRARLPETSQVDWSVLVPSRTELLHIASQHFFSGAPDLWEKYEAFCSRESEWLDEYALFMSLRERFGNAMWPEWPQEYVHRDEHALDRARVELADSIKNHRFQQFIADLQWRDLRTYAAERGIRIFGDLPIYVAHDSADVWGNPHLFHLNESGYPALQAGVPPDYFSETGQLWGNPIYRWDLMQQDGYSWWRRRLRRTLDQVDIVRLDHFRGLEAYWVVPAGEETAINGQWIEGPGESLLKALEDEVGRPLPLVAEDLGIITPGVRSLMAQFQLPGMVVIQFGFDGNPESEYLPHRYKQNQVAYTGTHDNNTFNGWLADDASETERTLAREYLKLDEPGSQPHLEAIHAVMASACDSVILPLQDILGLGTEGRMNIPGTEDGNWVWRCLPLDLDEPVAQSLRKLTEQHGRLVPLSSPVV